MIKIVIPGHPISKSNYKAFREDGRAYMASKGNDAKYKNYEEAIAWACKTGYNGPTIDEECILIIKLFFKNNRRGDAHNYPKSICDGIEKGNVITDDKHFKPIYIDGCIDTKNPRAEVGIYPQSKFKFIYDIKEKSIG